MIILLFNTLIEKYLKIVRVTQGKYQKILQDTQGKQHNMFDLKLNKLYKYNN